MPKGTVHSIKKKKVYLKTKKVNIKQAEHLFLDHEGDHHIIPVPKKKEHHSLKEGDKILFELHSRANFSAQSFFYGLPVTGFIVGLAVGKNVAGDALGMIIISLLFIAIALNLQYILAKRYDVHKKVHVVVKKDTSVKKKKVTKKKVTKKKVVKKKVSKKKTKKKRSK